VRLVLANHSSYPRVGDAPGQQRLRRAYAGLDTGKVTKEQLDEIERSYIAEVIKEQQDAGLDLVTDGQVYWYDVVAHPASRLEGTEIRGIVRFFDTNTYVRQPEVTGPIGGTFGLAGDFSRSKASATKTLKTVVTGPYTLARHSILNGNGDLSRTAMAYTEALGRELEALRAAGATFVQIDEPSLLKYPDDAEMVRNLLERAMQTKGDLTVSLTTYFGDASTIYGELMTMPVDMIGFDLVYGPGIVEALEHNGADRPVALGAIDGRNTKLEDVTTVADKVARVMEALDRRGVPEVHLQPSNGLEFLPRDKALRKLERMREIRDAVIRGVRGAKGSGADGPDAGAST
jgi:5-methyltetrahydropteroyltriglutamate--homocysteine methyltransferase